MKNAKKTTPATVSTEILLRITFADGSVLEEVYGTANQVRTPSTNGALAPVEGEDYRLTKRGGLCLLGFPKEKKPTPNEVRDRLPFVGEIADGLHSLMARGWTAKRIALHISMHPKWSWAATSVQTISGMAKLQVGWQASEGVTATWAPNTRSLAKLRVTARIVEEMVASRE